MGILEQVMQMREQGMPDREIVSQLQEQGASPKTINDALNQANIKSAVGNAMGGMESMQYNGDNAPSPQGFERYSPGPQENAEDLYIPQAQTPPQQYSYPDSGTQEYAYAESYPGAQYSVGTDADMMVEIAQQVFGEKIKKIQNQIEDLNEFKALYQAKTDGIYERLKRIESIMDRLQSAILERIGSYGAGIESVKKELSMMQDTYGKIVNAVAEKSHPSHHAPPEHRQEHPHRKSHRQRHTSSSHTSSKKHSKKKR